jgi:ubiquinone/menaquinone biosynthesis C-methylase UbiE
MERTGVRRVRSASLGAPGYLRLNLQDWERTAEWYEGYHRRSLERERGKAWGTFRIPERRLHLLGKVRGRRVLELGCGAADWSIALAREGARAVGLDFSEARLRQARDRIRRAGVKVSLMQANAESLPYPDGHFDIVLSDYGATTFANPRRTVPEVGRVLRTGGIFVFAHASPFRSVAEEFDPDRLQRALVRDYFRLGKIRRAESVEFQLPYGEWVRLFASCDLLVDRLIEPRAPRSPQSTYFSPRDQRWARHWPVESIWRLVKTRPGETSRRHRPANP